MYYAVKGNKDAVIFNAGFAIFAVVGLSESAAIFPHPRRLQSLPLEMGIVSFIIALIVILGRHFAKTTNGFFNTPRSLRCSTMNYSDRRKWRSSVSLRHRLRMRFVTRASYAGFLRLLTGKAQAAEREYLDLALVELDRASGIITDFLTFAKPEFGKDTVLRVAEEFKHIEGILGPLAHLQGGRITVDIPEDITIRGIPRNLSRLLSTLLRIASRRWAKRIGSYPPLSPAGPGIYSCCR